jgi:hypothetical protein
MRKRRPLRFREYVLQQWAAEPGKQHIRKLPTCAERNTNLLTPIIKSRLLSAIVSCGACAPQPTGCQIYCAAIPLNPAFSMSPPTLPRLVRVPSCWIAKIPMAPVPEFRLYKNLPSLLIAISRLVLPLGFVPTTVAPTGVSAPVALIAKPAIVEEAAFEL